MIVVLRNIAGALTVASLVAVIGLSALAGTPQSTHSGLTENSEVNGGGGYTFAGDGSGTGMNLYLNGVAEWFWDASEFSSTATIGPGVRDEVPSDTNPLFLIHRQVANSGLGGEPGTAGSISLIINAQTAVRADSDNTVSALSLTDTGTKPTCDASHRGWVWMDQAGAATADTLEVCAKNSSDTYAWYAMATIP